VLGGKDDEIGVVGLLVLIAEDEVPGPLVVIGPLVVEVEDEDKAPDEIILEEGPVIEELQFPH
jgi:hypothetical protein